MVEAITELLDSQDDIEGQTEVKAELSLQSWDLTFDRMRELLKNEYDG